MNVERPTLNIERHKGAEAGKREKRDERTKDEKGLKRGEKKR